MSTEFDAVHILIYPMSGRGRHRRPEPRGLMQISAAVEVISHGLSQNLVIGGVNRYLPEDGLGIPINYRGRLVSRLAKQGIEDTQIIIEPEVLPKCSIDEGGRDTGGEIDFALRIAKQNGWRKILTIGYGQHMRRIMQLYHAKGAEIDMHANKTPQDKLLVTPRSSNFILSQIYPTFAQRFENSPFKKDEGDLFRFREAVKLAFIYSVDPEGEWFTEAAKRVPDKIKCRISG